MKRDPVILAQESIDKLASAIAKAVYKVPSKNELPAEVVSEMKSKHNRKVPDLVALSGVSELLVSAAKTHGRDVAEAESVRSCTKALDTVQGVLSKKEKDSLERFIQMEDFKIFAGAWQKWHDQASKELFGR